MQEQDNQKSYTTYTIKRGYCAFWLLIIKLSGKPGIHTYKPRLEIY
jgi:hypothetical protein